MDTNLQSARDVMELSIKKKLEYRNLQHVHHRTVGLLGIFPSIKDGQKDLQTSERLYDSYVLAFNKKLKKYVRLNWRAQEHYTIEDYRIFDVQKVLNDKKDLREELSKFSILDDDTE